MQRDAPHGRVQTIADRKWHKHLTPYQKQTGGAEWVRMRATGSTSTRGSEVKGKTIEALTWLMEVERRMRFQVIENSMTRNALSASTFPGHPRCNSIPSCWVSMVRGVRFYSSLHLLSDTFGAGKHAPKRRTCILYGVMIPYGKCLVNYARCRPATNRNRAPPHRAFPARYAIPAPELASVLNRDPAYPFLAPAGFTKDGGVVWQAFKPRYTQNLHAG